MPLYIGSNEVLCYKGTTPINIYRGTTAISEHPSGPTPVSISDNFNSYADDDYLDAEADWNSSITSGARMRFDTHDDHSDGTIVVDGSGEMGTRQYAFHTTPLGSNNHEVMADLFCDQVTGNTVSILARGATTSSWDDCYRVDVVAGASGSLESNVVLVRRESGSDSTLATVALDPSDSLNSGAKQYRIRAVFDGADINVYSQSRSNTSPTWTTEVERIDFTETDPTPPSGNYAGISMWRGNANSYGQPFIDNFGAS